MNQTLGGEISNLQGEKRQTATKEEKVEREQEKGRDRQREKLGDVCDSVH